MVVSITMASGAVARYTLNPSEPHEGDSCGAFELLDVSAERGLTWSPRVLSAVTGELRVPTANVGATSLSETMPVLSSADPVRTYTEVLFKEQPYLGEFTLVPADRISEVAEVDVDGNAVFASDGSGHLVKLGAAGGGSGATDGLDARQYGAGPDAPHTDAYQHGNGYGYQMEF